MDSRDLLVDAFGRIREVVHQVVDGLEVEELAVQPDPAANSIAWLVWHLTRVQDDHVSDLAGVDQCWIAAGWAERFSLPFDDADTGYGHTPDEVVVVRTPAELLAGYHDAVFDHTVRYLEGVDAGELDRIVDRSWDPPVTAGVRIVSVIDDCAQHAGQAAYVRGLLERRR
jgi:Protein of unknown function (DUF664)